MPDIIVASHIDSFLQSSTPEEALTVLGTPPLNTGSVPTNTSITYYLKYNGITVYGPLYETADSYVARPLYSNDSTPAFTEYLPTTVWCIYNGNQWGIMADWNDGTSDWNTYMYAVPGTEATPDLANWGTGYVMEAIPVLGTSGTLGQEIAADTDPHTIWRCLDPINRKWDISFPQCVTSMYTPDVSGSEIIMKNYVDEIIYINNTYDINVLTIHMPILSRVGQIKTILARNSVFRVVFSVEPGDIVMGSPPTVFVSQEAYTLVCFNKNSYSTWGRTA